MRFLLVDRVTEIESGARIEGTKNVAMSEDYLEWHFPEQPILPGVLLLEASAQLASWLISEATDFGERFLLDRVHSARYYHFAVPGDQVRLCVTRSPGAEDGRARFEAETYVGDKRTAVLEFEGPTLSIDHEDDRRQARHAFGVLSGQGPLEQGR